MLDGMCIVTEYLDGPWDGWRGRSGIVDINNLPTETPVPHTTGVYRLVRCNEREATYRYVRVTAGRERAR